MADEVVTSGNDVIVWNSKFNSFQSMLAIVDYEHLKSCPCMRSRVLQELKVQTDSVISEMVEEGVSLDEFKDRSVREQRLHNAKVEAYKIVAKECENGFVRCRLEKFVVNDLLTHFDKDTGGLYDFSNSNVYLIMRSLVSQVLSTHRMQLHSDRFGIVREFFDGQGNAKWELNPVELAKARIDKQIVDCVEKLNNVMYGTKSLNVNLNVEGKEMLSVHDLLVKLKAMDVERVVDETDDDQ